MSTSESKEKPEQARVFSPSAKANASLVIYNKITVNINFGTKDAKPRE
jgi:hypothetical protein